MLGGICHISLPALSDTRMPAGVFVVNGEALCPTVPDAGLRHATAAALDDAWDDARDERRAIGVPGEIDPQSWGIGAIRRVKSDAVRIIEAGIVTPVPVDEGGDIIGVNAFALEGLAPDGKFVLDLEETAREETAREKTGILRWPAFFYDLHAPGWEYLSETIEVACGLSRDKHPSGYGDTHPGAYPDVLLYAARADIVQEIPETARVFIAPVTDGNTGGVAGSIPAGLVMLHANIVPLDGERLLTTMAGTVGRPGNRMATLVDRGFDPAMIHHARESDGETPIRLTLESGGAVEHLIPYEEPDSVAVGFPASSEIPGENDGGAVARISVSAFAGEGNRIAATDKDTVSLAWARPVSVVIRDEYAGDHAGGAVPRVTNTSLDNKRQSMDDREDPEQGHSARGLLVAASHEKYIIGQVDGAAGAHSPGNTAREEWRGRYDTRRGLLTLTSGTTAPEDSTKDRYLSVLGSVGRTGLPWGAIKASVASGAPVITCLITDADEKTRENDGLVFLPEPDAWSSDRVRCLLTPEAREAPAQPDPTGTGTEEDNRPREKPREDDQITYWWPDTDFYNGLSILIPSIGKMPSSFLDEMDTGLPVKLATSPTDPDSPDPARAARSGGESVPDVVRLGLIHTDGGHALTVTNTHGETRTGEIMVIPAGAVFSRKIGVLSEAATLLDNGLAIQKTVEKISWEDSGTVEPGPWDGED